MGHEHINYSPRDIADFKRHLIDDHKLSSSEVITLNRQSMLLIHNERHAALENKPKGQGVEIGTAPASGIALGIRAWDDGTVSVGGAMMTGEQLCEHIRLCEQGRRKAQELAARPTQDERIAKLLTDMITSKRWQLGNDLHSAHSLSEPCPPGRHRTADLVYDRALRHERMRTEAELQEMYQKNRDLAVSLQLDIAALDELTRRVNAEEW